MAKTDELFELIHSLNSNEKRYISMYADVAKSGKKYYLALYQGYLKMEEYDPDTLLTNFKNHFPEETITKKRLADHKSNLWESILKVMRSYNAEKSVDPVLSDAMQDADFLRGRKIYGKSFRVLQNAKKKALKFERYNILEDILKREIRVLMEWQRKGYEVEVKRIWEEIEALEKLAKQEKTLMKLVDELLMLMRNKSQALKEEERKQAEEFLQHPALQDGEVPESFEGIINFHYARAMAFQLLSRNQEAFETYREILTSWESAKHFTKEEPGRYKIAVHNFLNACHLVREYEYFPRYLKKLEELPDQNLDQQAESFSNINYLRFLYTINKPDLAAALKAVPEIEKGLKQYHDKINPSRVLAFYNNVSVAAWIKGKHKLAIEWNKKIRMVEKTSVRQDIQRFAFILRQIIAWEQGDEEAPEAIRGLLRSRKKYTGFNRAVLSGLRDLSEHPIRTTSREAWEKFQEKIRKFSNKSPFSFTEIDIWVESKIRDEKMEKILKERSAE